MSSSPKLNSLFSQWVGTNFFFFLLLLARSLYLLQFVFLITLFLKILSWNQIFKYIVLHCVARVILLIYWPFRKKCERLQIPIHMSRDLLMTAIQYFDYSLSFEESSKLFVEQKEITYCYWKYPQFYCYVLSSLISSLLSKLQSKIIRMCIGAQISFL